MTLKLAQFCDDPQKISTKSSYPKKIFIFLKTQINIEIQNFDPKKMDRAYVCVKISEYPPPPPGHTCTCIDGKLEDRLFITCIIMYRGNVRNIHVRACRGIHARVIIFKFPMKMKDLVPSKSTYFIFIGYLKTGGMEGFERTP